MDPAAGRLVRRIHRDRFGRTWLRGVRRPTTDLDNRRLRQPPGRHTRRAKSRAADRRRPVLRHGLRARPVPPAAAGGRRPSSRLRIRRVGRVPVGGRDRAPHTADRAGYVRSGRADDREMAADPAHASRITGRRRTRRDDDARLPPNWHPPRRDRSRRRGSPRRADDDHRPHIAHLRRRGRTLTRRASWAGTCTHASPARRS